MPIRVRTLAAVSLAAMLAACTATAPQPDAAHAPAAGVAAEGAAPIPASAPPAATQPAKPPRMAAPLPAQRKAGGDTVTVDRSCDTDADCAVKDVGNCCGYYPSCVNKDSPTDPEGVKAQCAKGGMSSVCGFPEISACTCNAGTCESAGGGRGEMSMPTRS